MNKFILWILGLMASLCLISMILSINFAVTSIKKHDYLSPGSDEVTQGGLVFFTYFILYNTMIPISLIVSLEFVKLIQSYFINNDYCMYNRERKIWSKVMVSTINEELG